MIWRWNVVTLSISAQLLIFRYFRVLPVVLFSLWILLQFFNLEQFKKSLKRNSLSSRFKEIQWDFKHQVSVVYNPVVYSVNFSSLSMVVTFPVRSSIPGWNLDDRFDQRHSLEEAIFYCSRARRTSWISVKKIQAAPQRSEGVGTKIARNRSGWPWRPLYRKEGNSRRARSRDQARSFVVFFGFSSSSSSYSFSSTS